MNLCLGTFFMAGACAATITCARPAAERDVGTSGTRSYFMGFSVVPPKPDIGIAVKSLDIWSKRADAAIMHLDVPWAQLLAGASAADALRKDGVDLERYYRSKHLRLVVTIDVTNGLAREREAAALVAAHRSITEPAVQRVDVEQRLRRFSACIVTTSAPSSRCCTPTISASRQRPISSVRWRRARCTMPWFG